MKTTKHLACLLLVLLTPLACRTQSKSPPDSGAEQTAGVNEASSQRSTRLLASGDVLVSATDQQGRATASYLRARSRIT
jgi:hypothetical protein